MEGRGIGYSGGIRDHYVRAEDYTGEFARAIVVLRHRPARRVPVFGYHDAGVRAQVQVGEQVASRERREQQFLGAVAGRIAAKGGVGRAGQWLGLAGDRDFVVSRIGAVICAARAEVAGPGIGYGVVMLASRQYSIDGKYEPAGS